MSQSRDKLRSVILVSVLLFSAIVAGSVMTGSVAAAANTSSLLEISDVSQNGEGDLTVTVNATTTKEIQDFQLWYDSLSGTALGPASLGGASTPINLAYYANGDRMSAGDPLASDIKGGKATFVFDSANTNWVYENDEFQVNVTAFDTDYASADPANRSVYTPNYYRIDAQDHTGSGLSGIPVLLTNASTNASKGFAFMPGEQSLTFDCMGANGNGDCIDPATGAFALLKSRSTPTPVTEPVEVTGFSLSNANGSERVNPTMGSTTLTVDIPTAPTFMGWDSATTGGGKPTVDNLTVLNATSGNVYWQSNNVGAETGAPILLRTNTEYTVSLENGSTFGTANRSLLIPTKGMTDVRFRIDTTGLSASTVVGQVVNDSGSPVPNAVVMAQPTFAGGSQLQLYNSTTTDSNGLFTMALPQTDELGAEYAFRMLGTQTSGDTLIYYPTIDANDGDGYVAPSDRTVIPPMAIDKGGRVDITVTKNQNQKTLPVRTAFTSLSQESTAFPKRERTAVSNGFSTFGFGQTLPASASVALMSPTTGTDTNVFYNVWGMNNNWLCANQVAVSQGSATSSTCGLEQAGYLNISLTQYESLLQRSTASLALVETNQFFFDNELIIRDAKTGNVVTHLGPDGIQQFLITGDGDSKDIAVPLPGGKYTVELRPARDRAPLTSVNETGTVSVQAGSTTDLALDRGGAFPARPVFDRFDTSLERSADNTLAVQVRDPVSGRTLTDSNISVRFQLLHLNGTSATSPVQLTYNSTGSSFDTTTFDPSAHGVDAGRYRGLLTVTHTNGSRVYNSTFSGPLQVSGFDMALNLGSRTIGPGDTLNGQIRAYSGGSGIDAKVANIDIRLVDENGQVVNTTNPNSGISSGTGSFSVTMPATPGRYQLSVTVESDAGNQGIAQQWIEVEQIQLDVSTNKRVYGPSETVRVTAEATNATDGSAVENATTIFRINNQQVPASTNSNGIARVKLDPGTYASGTWRRGHPVGVLLTAQTDTGVIRKSSGTFFEVSRFSIDVEPTSESFSPSENVKLRVTVPSSVTVNSVKVTELDGKQVSIGGSRVTQVAQGVYTVDLGPGSVGEHFATVEVRTQSGTETASTAIRIEQYALSASLNGRTFDAGETINLNVAVREPGTGNAVSGQSVSAQLNATGPVRPIDSAKATTDSNGEASVSLSSSVGGEHVVTVTVGKQTRRLGLMVSNVNARFEDANGNPVSEYRARPGTSQTIYINATQDGNPVADGATVEAAVITRDGPQPLGSASTSGGVSSIDFTIPSSVPAGEYSLAARVLAGESTGIARGTLNVTGSTAKAIEASTNRSQLSAGDPVEFQARVTQGDGSPIPNEPVDFVVLSRGSPETRVATVSTNSDGVARYDYQIPAGAADGEYILRTELNNSQSIQAYSGYRVSSINVEVQAGDGPFNPGEAVPLTVFANDSATGAPVTATSGTVTLVLSGSNVQTQLAPSGQSPYSTSITLPDDSSIVGSRSITVRVQNDRQSDSDSTVVDVRDASEDANLSIARPVTAGTATTVTMNGTVDETGILTAYSPGSGRVAFNTSVAISSTADTTTQMTIDTAGTYVVSLTVPSVGEITKYLDVRSPTGPPTVTTGTDLGLSNETFNTTESIYIQTNQTGLTATVLTQNASYSLALDQQSGGTSYGILSADRPPGIYAVRLDSSRATNLNTTIMEVE